MLPDPKDVEYYEKAENNDLIPKDEEPLNHDNLTSAELIEKLNEKWREQDE